MGAPVRSMVRPVLALVAAGLLMIGLAACSGDEPVTEGKTPEQVMAAAKAALDETHGVHIELAAEDLPDSVTGVQRAEGVGNHDPAFEGTITVPVAGTSFDVPVIAVDGKVYAQLPLTGDYQEVDPADYGAPDPAELMRTDGGLSSLLTETTNLQEGDTVRGGKNNDEVLTEYTGTVPSSAVEVLIPSASGDFDATYRVASAGELRTAELTGQFYSGEDPVTYTVTFDEYGTQADITAP